VKVLYIAATFIALAILGVLPKAHAIQGCTVEMWTQAEADQVNRATQTSQKPRSSKRIVASRGDKFASKTISRAQTCRVCEQQGISVAINECKRSRGRYSSYTIDCTRNNGSKQSKGTGFGLWKKTMRKCL